MKFTLVFLAVLPFVFATNVQEKRLLESLLGGFDIVDLATQVLAQFGTDETEQQCEDTFCPEIVGALDGDNDLITGLVCGLVCKEVQILAQNFAPAS